MEFHITMAGAMPDPTAVEYAIAELDPAAVVDLGPAGGVLRVATSLDAATLVALVDRAGHPVTLAQVYQVPSVCCGGCSG